MQSIARYMPLFSHRPFRRDESHTYKIKHATTKSRKIYKNNKNIYNKYNKQQITQCTIKFAVLCSMPLQQQKRIIMIIKGIQFELLYEFAGPKRTTLLRQAIWLCGARNKNPPSPLFLMLIKSIKWPLEFFHFWTFCDVVVVFIFKLKEICVHTTRQTGSLL